MDAYFRSRTMSPIHRSNNLHGGPFTVDLRDPGIFPYLRPTPTSLPPFISPLPFPFPGAAAAAAAAASLVGPPVDWKETREAHVFMANVPGMRKEEVLVEVEEGNVLKISGGPTGEEKERGETWHRAERSMGSFIRRFQLPASARMDQASATMANGVLTVTIPKKEPKKHEINSIEIYG